MIYGIRSSWPQAVVMVRYLYVSFEDCVIILGRKRDY
jgi:hypothetical protein